MSPTHPPIKGIALGFLAYFLFSCSDANVKALGGHHLPVFEIGFFSTLFAALVLLFLRPKDERWRDAVFVRRPMLVALRGIFGAAAGILGIYAFTTLPFAEAYALIFLSPSIATILSIFILAEQVGCVVGSPSCSASRACSRSCGRASRRWSSAIWRRSPSPSAQPAPSSSFARWDRPSGGSACWPPSS